MNLKLGGISACFLLIMLFLWRTPTSMKNAPEQVVQLTEKTSKRKIRKGPRTPPIAQPPNRTSSSSTPTNLPKTTHEADNASSTESEELDPKVQLYLDNLDAIEEPSVEDLTYLGELAFEANDPASAYDHYLEVIEGHADDPMAPFALYKFAWVQYNLGEVDAAIADMNLMIEWIEESDFSLDQTLRESAYSDLELFQRGRK